MSKQYANRSRIVLPDGNGVSYDTVLQHRVGDPITWENSDGQLNGWTVIHREVIGDTVYLHANLVVRY